MADNMALKGYLRIKKSFGQFWHNTERMKYVSPVYLKLSIRCTTANQVVISVHLKI